MIDPVVVADGKSVPILSRSKNIRDARLTFSNLFYSGHTYERNGRLQDLITALILSFLVSDIIHFSIIL
jgi:hypothetical protein